MIVVVNLHFQIKSSNMVTPEAWDAAKPCCPNPPTPPEEDVGAAAADEDDRFPKLNPFPNGDAADPELPPWMQKKRIGQTRMTQMSMLHQKLMKQLAMGKKRRREHLLGQKGRRLRFVQSLGRADCWIEIDWERGMRTEMMKKSQTGLLLYHACISASEECQ